MSREEIEEALAALSPQDRMAVLSSFCWSCGDYQPDGIDEDHEEVCPYR